MANLRQQLINRYRDIPLPKVDRIKPVSMAGRVEMPRYPIRYRLLFCALLVLLVSIPIAVFFVNPASLVQDARLGTRYNDQRLTSVATESGGRVVWIGTDGGGIKIFHAKSHFFGRDLLSEQGRSGLLSNHIVDLAIGPRNFPVAAVVTRGVGGNGESIHGLQAVAAASKYDSWPAPLVEMSWFPGLTDSNASCVAATPDGELLVIGTKGAGFGVYRPDRHQWCGVYTTTEGLLSNVVHDLKLAVATGEEADSLWLYLATDHGIATGRLDSDGKYSMDATLGVAQGLAGDDVRELNLVGGFLWYRTAGRGLGRLPVGASGEMSSNQPPQILVSESRLPGLEDRRIVLAAGSPAGSTTWFAAEIGEKTHIGRYHEFPHDTAGIPAPNGFPSAAEVTALVVEPSTGSQALFATTQGAWFFKDGSSSGTDTPRISSKFVGPSGVQIDEIALSHSRAIIKSSARSARPILLQAPVADKESWKWEPIVGDGRFPGVQSLGDLTCVAAGAGKGLVYLGTRNQGIGAWDRERMELRLERHSSESSPLRNLRQDSSIDLAVAGDKLVQVTGDMAVDVYTKDGRQALIPASSAPIDLKALGAVAAGDRWFACADDRGVGIYDSNTMQWRHVVIAQVEQLDITASRIWVLVRTGNAYSGLLTDQREWTEVVSNVKQMAVDKRGAHFLLAGKDGCSVIRSLSAETAEEFFALTPVPLSSAPQGWRFAAGIAQDLIMVGENSFDRYQLHKRSWQRSGFPESLRGPIQLARQNSAGLWLLDAASKLHCYALAEEGQLATVAQGIRKISAGGSAVLALAAKDDEQGSLVEYELGKANPRRVVGRQFGGDLGSVTDAAEWKGANGFVVIEQKKIGFYDRATHDWQTILTPFDRLDRLHVVGDTLWAEARQGEFRRLLQWNGREFEVVKSDGDPVVVAKIKRGEDALWVLDNMGRVLCCEVAKPDTAKEIIAASRFGGSLPILFNNTALVDGELVVAGDRMLHRFVDHDGPGRWMKIGAIPPGIERMVQSPAGSQLVIASPSAAWRLSLADQGPAIVPLGSGKSGQQLKGIVASDSFVASAYPDPSGNMVRVQTLEAITDTHRELLGQPYPPSGPTRSIVEIPKSGGGLIRLSEDGIVGAYSPEKRHWQIEQQQSKLTRLWINGDHVMGYSDTVGGLQFRADDGRWQDDLRFPARISSVAPFAERTLVQLEDLSVWQFRTSSDKPVMIRPPRNRARQPGLGPLISAEQWEDVLLLVDQHGKLGAFSWDHQQWLEHQIPRVDSIESFRKQLYFMSDGSLRGPVSRKEGTLLAPAISLKIRQLIRHQERVFGVSVDGAVHELSADGDRWNRLGNLEESRSKGFSQSFPLKEAGEIHKVEEVPGFLLFRGKGGSLVAFQPGQQRWSIYRGIEPVKEVISAGASVFFAVEGRLVGPIAASQDRSFSLLAPEIVLPDNRKVQRVSMDLDRLILHEAGGTLWQFSETDGVLDHWQGPPPLSSTQDPAPPPVAVPVPVPVVKRGLRDWVAINLGEGTFKRRFADKQDADVKLAASGFDFEQTEGLDVREGKVRIFTQAGELSFDAASDTLIPLSLDRDARLPDEAAGGTVRLHERGRLLYRKGADVPEWLEVKGSWSEIPSALKATLAAEPLLTTAAWEWRKPGSTGEIVRWSPLNAPVVEGFFDRRAGYFDWDRCFGIGQSRGEAWMLTKAGLCSFSASRISNEIVAIPIGVDGTLTFLEQTGDSAGMLLKNGEPFLVNQGGQWLAAEKVQKNDLANLLASRLAGASWRIPRRQDSGLQRALPQAPQEFADVRLNNKGQWDYESVRDLLSVVTTCYLATEHGISMIAAAGDRPAGIFPFPGGMTKFALCENKPIALSSTGKLFTVTPAGCQLAAGTFPSEEETEVREGNYSRITKTNGVVQFDFKSNVEGVFWPGRPERGRFAFDHVLDMECGPNGVALVSTKMGLVEIDRDGNVNPVSLPGNSGRESITLFSTPDGDGGWKPLAKCGAEFWARRDAWQPLSVAEGSNALERSATLLLQNRTWRVICPSSGAVEIGLHLPNDENEKYKVVSFDSASRLFDFDRFITLAPAGLNMASLVIGTTRGAQQISFDPAGTLQRLWRDQAADGLGPDQVASLIQGRAGRLEAATATDYFVLDAGAGKFSKSNEQAYREGHACRAEDLKGWSVRFEKQPGAGPRLDMRLRNMPVRLVHDQGLDGIRFAHDIVHSVELINDNLVMATEGGLLTSVSLDRQDPASWQLAGSFADDGDDWWLPADFRWLERDAQAGFIRACNVDGTVSRFDLANLAKPNVVTPLSGEKLESITMIAQDDVLVWHQAGLGKVGVAFSPGKAIPKSLQPELGEGTFRFLELKGKTAAGPTPASLLGTSDGAFWACAAGVVHYDTSRNEFAGIQAAVEPGNAPMTTVEELFVLPSDQRAYARIPNGYVAFDSKASCWMRANESERLAAGRDIVNESSMLEWRRTGPRGVAIHLRSSDKEGIDFFKDGKPAIDEIADLAFVNDPERNLLAAATAGGVVEYGAGDFSYLKTYTKALEDESLGTPVPITEVAACAAEGDTKTEPRLCARVGSGDGYFFDGTKWTKGEPTEVTDVFRASYLRDKGGDGWIWSQHPTGLVSRLEQTNGPPLELGSAADASLGPIFRNGRMVKDEVQGVVFAGGEMLVTTSLGVARYHCDQRTVSLTETGLDVWLGAESGGELQRMADLQGITADEESVIVWGGDGFHRQTLGSPREWVKSGLEKGTEVTGRVLKHDSVQWVIEPYGGDGKGVRVSFGRASPYAKKQYIPIRADSISDAAFSIDGLWLLTGNELYHVNRFRAWCNPTTRFGASADEHLRRAR